MKEPVNLPRISVIIPVKPEGSYEPALAALRKVVYPEDLVEVFVTQGLAPSKQRNKAVARARGEILFFLDNDSEVDRMAFKRVVNAFAGQVREVSLSEVRGFSLFPQWLSDGIVRRFFAKKVYRGEIGAVGGPNVWWREELLGAALAGAVLESFFCHSLMAARYRPIGSVHRANEKELILCNLAIRRNVFLKAGGFNGVLYPNEENELLNRIEKAGFQLVYHPGVLVTRPRRPSLHQLMSAFFHYGRGRMEQARVEGFGYSLPFFLPLVFFGYLVSLIFYHPWFAWLPLGLYLSMSLGSALGFAVRKKKYFLVFVLPWLFMAAHLAYAWGSIYGLVTDLETKRTQEKEKKVKVVRIKALRQKWQSK